MRDGPGPPTNSHLLQRIRRGGLAIPIDAVVLAGGHPAPELAGDGLPKAFAPLGSSTMVEHVLGALRSAARIGRIAIVGPAAMPAHVAAAAALTVPAPGGLLENLTAGLRALRPALDAGQGHGDPPVLAAAADVPLLTGEAVTAFLDAAVAADAEVAYAVVRREDVVAAFPGVRKTFVRLADGVFTGGSLVLLRPAAFMRALPLVERAVAARKRPWELARLFGIATLAGLATGRVRIEALERRAASIAGLSARAIICRDPAVALDVDNRDMLDLVRARLRARGGAVPAAPEEAAGVEASPSNRAGRGSA